MTEGSVRERLILDGSSQPKLKRFMKLKRDETRDRWVLLAPERVLTPDDISVVVLELCDGEKTIDDLTAALSEKYNAPEDTIRADIMEMLQDLADKGYLTA